MNLIILNGRVVDPAQNINKKINIEIKNGKINNYFSGQPKKNINLDKYEIINAKNMIISPGFIDLHVHLRDPGLVHKENIKTGSDSAASGGFTSIACMPNTFPPNDNPKITKYILKTAEKDSKINIFPIGAITKNQQGNELAKIKENIN